MTAYNADDERRELTEVQNEIDRIKENTINRAEKVDDLTSRFRELRRRNHFRLMLEEIFNE